MRKIDKVIIHCTATPDGREVSVRDIDSWHRQRGFSGIGYHFLVHLDGSVSIGRPAASPGAHTQGHNTTSIGVCYVGGLSAAGEAMDTRTQAQKEALRQLVSELLATYAGATVHGHREFAAKACPCFDARAEYAEFEFKHAKAACA